MTLLQDANTHIAKYKNTVDETYRNKFHLMPPIGWMNDPNGFIYYKGNYHLFYQFYPYDSVWGPMHWGHAMSSDGIHWKDLPVALAPDQDYDKRGCFSGTAYVEDDVLYLFYTGYTKENGHRRQVQCLATSTDGINFKKHEHNPLVKEEHIEGLCNISDFRDPKVMKRNDTYYMFVAANTENNHGQILVFTSKNLINWSKGRVFLEGNDDQGEMWECPDLFHLDGKDVLIMSPIKMPPHKHQYTNHSSTVAYIGTVDWEQLKFEVENYHEIDSGMDFYAPQTTLNHNQEVILTAWMQMWHRTPITHNLNHKWIGSMVLPRTLSLKNNLLNQRPIDGIYEMLNLNTKVLTDGNFLGSDLNYLRFISLKDEPFELKLAASLNEEITLSYNTKCLTLSRENSGHKIVGYEGEAYTSRFLEIYDDLNLEIFIDTSSIEVFINHKYTMTFLFFKKENQRDFLLDGSLKNKEITIGKLKDTSIYHK